MTPAVEPSSPLTPAVPAAPSASTRPIDGLRLIALLKYGKALLLLATSYGMHRLLDPALFEHLRVVTGSMTDGVDRRLLERALTWIQGLDPSKAHLVVLVTTLYTIIAFVEGTSLWLRRPWGEWLTVTATASLMPFELWELLQRPPGKRTALVLTLLVNLLIVGYLVKRLRAARRAPPGD